VPLVVKDRVVGVMNLESDRVAFFTDDHVRLLTTLAPQVAIAIENARLYEEIASREKRMQDDLKAARKLQRILIPRTPPETERLKISAGSRPAREVSGDIYDFIAHQSGHTMIAFGDSSGKGAAAALYGAMVFGVLRSLGTASCKPAEMMRTLNDTLIERRVDAQYVVLMLMLFDPGTLEMRMANSGATPPVIVRKGRILKPAVAGIPLGLLEVRDYEEVSFQCQPGDLIVLYSDGFEDQGNGGEEHFGHRLLNGYLIANAHRSPREISHGLYAALDRFRGAVDIHDDQTVIVMKVT